MMMPTADERVTELQEQVNTLAWLHTELCEQMDTFATVCVRQITTVAWLHTELVAQLKEVLSQQQALVARAKAIRLAQSKASAGVR